jgi:uncharacterized damage-inducible protein DinB
MALITHFRTMARNNAWSNHRLHAACAHLTPAELPAPRTGFLPSVPLPTGKRARVRRWTLL